MALDAYCCGLPSPLLHLTRQTRTDHGLDMTLVLDSMTVNALNEELHKLQQGKKDGKDGAAPPAEKSNVGEQQPVGDLQVLRESREELSKWMAEEKVLRMQLGSKMTKDSDIAGRLRSLEPKVREEVAEMRKTRAAHQRMALGITMKEGGEVTDADIARALVQQSKKTLAELEESHTSGMPLAEKFLEVIVCVWVCVA